MRNRLRALWLMIAIAVRADGPRSGAAVVTAVGQSVSWPLRAVGLKLLVNGAIVHSLNRALFGAFLTAGLSALSRVMGWASLNVRMRLRENTQLYLDSHLMGLTAGIPGIAHHELPEYLDRVELIRNERDYLANPFNPISWTIAAALQTVSVVGLLASVDLRLALLPLAGIPAAFAVARSERARVSLDEAHAEQNRLLRHFLELATEAPAAKEIRLYGLADELLERREVIFDRLEGECRRQARRDLVWAGLAWGFLAVAFGVALSATVRSAVHGTISVGAVVLVLSLSSLISSQVINLASNITWFVRTYRAVGRLLWFREYAADAQAAAAPKSPRPTPDRLRDGVRFEGVAFTYPGTERSVLEEIDLLLPAGATVALVGDNGAGKTTLVKLLARLYEPTGGRITVDGVDLRDLEIDEWRARVSAGFQDFGQLKLIARESVGVGDLVAVESEPQVLQALDRAAASDVLESLPDRLRTQLGREFDEGVDLSLGQWQKLALGRAMMRQAPLLLILDEPTASLDAPTEHALFERFASAADRAAQGSGATTVLVSHRFSTVRMADLIVVLDEGRMLEVGTHDELIASRGLYAELFALQATSYR